MVTNKEKLLALGKKMTDRIPYKLGLQKLTEQDPEFWGLEKVLDDEMVDIALSMKQRTPMTLDEIAKAAKRTDKTALEAKLQEMSCLGLLEYNWENPERRKQYVLPLFVPGAAEFLNMRMDVVKEHPEVSNFFERMSRLPLEAVTPMVPLGGAGIGMHVIPVEKAIPAGSKSVSVEHLSHWLKKYDYFSVGVCSCRRSQTVRGQGTGDIEDHWCIAVGDCAKYCDETGKDGKHITYEEAMEIIQRAEEEGYVHQITNIDGEDKIFAICNCAPGVCYALRTSQLFNTPNLSRSAYRAHVDKENCVACGKCVEVCPVGAAKLGQKLCTSHGPVIYPKQELPDDNAWGPEKWDENYRDSAKINCYDTGTAPCKTACPAHIAVQGYVKMAAQGRYAEALELIKQDNPFPAVCGSICNRRCEDACTRGDIDAPVAIDEIKKFVAELELKEEHRYIPPIRSRRNTQEPYDERIAIIGAGPSGLSCAYYLAKMSYKVTVFDRNPAPGGMLTYGIPSFRLGRDVINAEIDVLRAMGVEFRCGVEVGKDVTIQQLRDEGYKGFYLAIGAQKSAPIGVPGEELAGVYGGIEFLRKVNMGEKPAIGKKCAVIGGGNVAMDVCRTVVRCGAKETYVIYRRSEEEMPADKLEVAEAKEEGVKFCFLNSPAEILGKDGKVTGLKVEVMELGEPDEQGRRKPVGTGNFETIKVDSVIGAVGQVIDLGSIDAEGMTFSAKGTVEVDPVTLQTKQSDIFAGGDFVTGPKFAIDAIAAGREAAESLHRFVHPGQSLTLARDLRHFIELDKSDVAINMACFDNTSRQVPGRDASKAKTFENDHLAFTEEQLKKETSRCLGCGVTVVDENRCIGCGLCTTRCEFDAIHLSRDLPEASTMLKAEDKLKAILPYAAKREIKILRKKVGKK